MGTFRRSAIGLALFGSLVLGCPGPEPSALGAGGAGAAGNGGQGGDDKVSSSSTSTGPTLGGEGGGGMSAGGMNSGGAGGCDLGSLMTDPEHCGNCGVNCNVLEMLPNTVGVCMSGMCVPKCDPGFADLIADEPGNMSALGCETPARRVFVTFDEFTATAVDSAQNANALCEEAALGLGGTWKAWLSDESSWPAKDHEQSDFPYILVDGKTKVAESWGGLIVDVNASLKHEINLTELTMPIGDNAKVWTGTSVFGTRTLLDCSNWNPAMNGSNGTVGSALAKDATWTHGLAAQCGPNSTAHLYCFEQ